MEISEIIGILERHNKWRKGADIEMENPTRLGKAIDEAVALLREYEKVVMK